MTRAREVSIELLPESDPVCGRIHIGDSSRPFSGWVDLVEALEAARADPAVDDERAGGSTWETEPRT